MASSRLGVSRVRGFALVGAAAAASFAAANTAKAQIVVDGSLDPAYGTAKAVQQNPTGFGDAATPGSNSNGGSELDDAYTAVQNGNLYILLTGNLEQNYNDINIFIQSNGLPAGQSVLNAPAGSGLSGANGLTFGPGFTPNFSLNYNGGGGSATTPDTEYVDQYTLTASPTTEYLGSFSLPTTGISAPSNVLTSSDGTETATAAINNTNFGGVTASDASLASTVTTGVELEIPLSELGNPTEPLTIMADINGSGDDYLSNQFLSSLADGTGNLGSPASVVLPAGLTFSQDVSVPEPASLGLVLGAAGLLINRRRRTF